jgi:predicted permease
MQSLQHLRTADPGFSADHVLASAFDLVAAGYDAQRAKRFREDLLDRVQALPGVESAAWERSRPFSYVGYLSAPITVDGYEPAPDERPKAEYNQVDPGYFATVGIPILSGRDFTRSDNETTFPVAIVNQQMVAKYWHGVDPVGKRIQLSVEVPKSFLYVPIRQGTAVNGDFVIRTAQSPGTMASALLREVRALDSGLGMGEVITLRENLNRTALASQQIVVALLTIFAVMALSLAAVGLYGVMSYSVSQSKREIGLRMALGAGTSNLFRRVMSHGLTLSIAGILVGSAAAFVLTRFIAIGSLLYKVNPLDPKAFVLASAVMIVISVAACLVPAWRAARTNPIQALRE